MRDLFDTLEPQKTTTAFDGMDRAEDGIDGIGRDPAAFHIEKLGFDYFNMFQALFAKSRNKLSIFKFEIRHDSILVRSWLTSVRDRFVFFAWSVASRFWGGCFVADSAGVPKAMPINQLEHRYPTYQCFISIHRSSTGFL